MQCVDRRLMFGVVAAVGTVAAAAHGQTTLIRVAQARVGGADRGTDAFNANVLGVIRPWMTEGNARAFYAYDFPDRESFNGPVPLTSERIHLFFAQASDGLCAYAVYDKPQNADGGRVQVRRWVWPSAAVFEDMSAIDREQGACVGDLTIAGGADSRWGQYLSQRWGACCTDGWAIRIDQATWTAVRVALIGRSSGDEDNGPNCVDEDLYRGITSMAVISGDGTATPLRLGQETVQFAPVAPCELVAWPSQQARCAGGVATFSARPNTAGTASFVWRKGGVDVKSAPPRITIGESADGLESTLTILDLTADDAGSYTCEATSKCGAQTSEQLTLAVALDAPTTTDPAPTRACVGQTATFSVTPGGSGPFTFQWLKNGVMLHDLGSRFAGTDAATLQVLTVASSSIASYACVVTNGCGAVTSAAAALTTCIADFNCDTTVTSQDFFDFLPVFFDEDPRADINGDDAVNSQDFFDFLTAFFGKCS